MGLKVSIGSPRDLISSSERMKYRLCPVAKPRLIWKKSEMVAIPDRLLTPAAGKRVHFDSFDVLTTRSPTQFRLLLPRLGFYNQGEQNRSWIRLGSSGPRGDGLPRCPVRLHRQRTARTVSQGT